MEGKMKHKSSEPSSPAPKRRKQKKQLEQPTQQAIPSSSRTSIIGVTRSISACQRCRNRKTRCDQKFPSCTACLKANVECVGIDAATGREIPRSYVSHLEDRVAFLETKLQSSGIDIDSKPNGLGKATTTPKDPVTDAALARSKNPRKKDEPPAPSGSTAAPASKVGNIMSSVRLVNDRPPKQKLGTFLGQSSGLSFARILFTAVKMRNQQEGMSSTGSATPNQNTNNTNANNGNNTNTNADSSAPPEPTPTPKPKIKPARLPTKEVAESLLSAYFSQANAQLPILHREEFLKCYFEPVYGKMSTKVSLASDYTTINAELSDEVDMNCYYYKYCYNVPEQADDDESTLGSPNAALYFLNMVFGIATSIHQQQYPAHISESYRLAAAHHFDAVFATSNRLENLQGLLLLALYSIMRPAVPGVWYVLGSCMRLCIDLGLHYEGGLKSWSKHHNNHRSDLHLATGTSEFDPVTVDMRRRLFWCTYALDRQVCVYLGRPFSISDEAIKVPFPSELDDSMINRDALSRVTDFSKETSTAPSYKTVSLSFIKIRLIQSEIQRILYDCAEIPRKYKSLDEWKHAMARKLEDWHNQCPKSNRKMNCNFNLAFFELNYHQTRLLLYGLSPGNTAPTVESYLIIADAGEKIIKKYHELHRKRNINYTWVAVHNLFMSGTSYLYALYQSPEVRAGTTLEEIDFNTLACIHVLSSMTDRCDAAAGCRDSFELLTAAIMKLCYNEKAGIGMNVKQQQQQQQQQQSLPPPPQQAQAMTPVVPGAALASDISTPGSASINLEEPIAHPPHHEMSWPMPDDLEMFFHEAAQLEGISPDSMRTGGTSHSPENTSWYQSSEAEGPDSTERWNYQTHGSSHDRTDQQRIYDIMNEIPLAPIWDQFFAPPGGGSGGGQNSGNASMDTLGSRW
ncbi:pyrimidine pathway regulatory protein 1 [Trichomonascus vanleenenianus]|uniref:pyrimidine pathway regulatory protein 1 n=1 Tax=Trichomonascus vanleenenianus TaxID=2268995 RepID=UPI003EC9B125